MAFSLGFGGGKSSSTQTSSSNSTTTGKESSNQTTQRLDQATLDAVTKIFTDLSGGIGDRPAELSKDAAIADTQGVVQNLFDNFSKSVLPQIMQKAFTGGAYNSTAANLIANDAFAQTVNKAAEVQLGAISQYEAAGTARQQVQNTTLGTILQTLLGSKEVTNLVSSLESNTKSSATGKTKGKSASGGFGLSF